MSLGVKSFTMAIWPGPLLLATTTALSQPQPDGFWEAAQILTQRSVPRITAEIQQFQTPYGAAPTFFGKVSEEALSGSGFELRIVDLDRVTLIDSPYRMDYGASLLAEHFYGTYTLFLFNTEEDRRIFQDEYLLAYQTIRKASLQTNKGDRKFAYLVPLKTAQAWIKSRGERKDFQVTEVGELNSDRTQEAGDRVLHFKGNAYFGYQMGSRFFKALPDPDECRRQLAYASHAAILLRTRGMIR